MAITQAEIDRMIARCKDMGDVSHVLVVSDTFDYSTYIAMVYKHEDFEKKMKELNNYENMSRVMEVHKI